MAPVWVEGTPLPDRATASEESSGSCATGSVGTAQLWPRSAWRRFPEWSRESIRFVADRECGEEGSDGGVLDMSAPATGSVPVALSRAVTPPATPPPLSTTSWGGEGGTAELGRELVKPPAQSERFAPRERGCSRSWTSPRSDEPSSPRSSSDGVSEALCLREEECGIGECDGELEDLEEA